VEELEITFMSELPMRELIHQQEAVGGDMELLSTALNPNPSPDIFAEACDKQEPEHQQQHEVLLIFWALIEARVSTTTISS